MDDGQRFRNLVNTVGEEQAKEIFESQGLEIPQSTSNEQDIIDQDRFIELARSRLKKFAYMVSDKDCLATPIKGFDELVEVDEFFCSPIRERPPVIDIPLHAIDEIDFDHEDAKIDLLNLKNQVQLKTKLAVDPFFGYRKYTRLATIDEDLDVSIIFLPSAALDRSGEDRLTEKFKRLYQAYLEKAQQSSSDEQGGGDIALSIM